MLGRQLYVILCCFVLHVACDSAGTCVRCEEGMPCFVNVTITEETCPPFSRLLTQSDNSSECVCDPGFFMADGSCVPCVAGYYCPGFYADARRAVGSAPYINSAYIDYNNNYTGVNCTYTGVNNTYMIYPEISEYLEIPEYTGRSLLQIASSHSGYINLARQCVPPGTGGGCTVTVISSVS